MPMLLPAVGVDLHGVDELTCSVCDSTCCTPRNAVNAHSQNLSASKDEPKTSHPEQDYEAYWGN